MYLSLAAVFITYKSTSALAIAHSHPQAWNGIRQTGYSCQLLLQVTNILSHIQK